jgi:hypothetical protein
MILIFVREANFEQPVHKASRFLTKTTIHRVA